MSKLWLTALVVVALVAPALAQDAEVGKEYEITIAAEADNQYVGPHGTANVGGIVFLIPNAKKAEKYKVKVLAIKENQYTNLKQASCDFQQVGGDRKGQCIGAP